MKKRDECKKELESWNKLKQQLEDIMSGVELLKEEEANRKNEPPVRQLFKIRKRF